MSTKDFAIETLGKGFASLDEYLINSMGKFSIGNEITMADCMLVP